ncbi:VWA domain-containing protein [Actinomycetospora endophytica]|uniref:VWA domain-containing protein n=1 Tax=Actinomycetospora endophytica TaxID=2291215 RepID=A0ABS8PD27_9PSEU|nr:VWA domain-containing protein [Actinomycetospora endophytica]MCD2196143.1 VWA domain-containing protein [Actinomycetospora endophytica]
MTHPQGAQLLPFYLVLDVSLSMRGDKLDAANQIMPTIRDTLAENPILADKVRFSVIDFSDDAQVRMPLCDPLDEAVDLPTMKVRGRTSYASAFWLLRSEIESDIKQLKADGFAVFRPAVFFLTDGLPTDKPTVWRDAFADLTHWDKQTQQGFRTYPNIIPCGVGQADPAVLRELIHPAEGAKRMQMYLMEQGGDAARAISAIAEILVSSVVASGQSMTQGGTGLVLPEKALLPVGVDAYTADDDIFM